MTLLKVGALHSRRSARRKAELDPLTPEPPAGWRGLLRARLLGLELGGSPILGAHLPAFDEPAFALCCDLAGFLHLSGRRCGSGLCFRRRRFTAATRQRQARAKHHRPRQGPSKQSGASMHVLSVLPPPQVDARDGVTHRRRGHEKLPVPTCLFDTPGETQETGRSVEPDVEHNLDNAKALRGTTDLTHRITKDATFSHKVQVVSAAMRYTSNGVKSNKRCQPSDLSALNKSYSICVLSSER
jgi:hypothetical protein